MSKLPLALLLVAISALGQTPDYQDATLVGLQNVVTGNHCSTNADTNGNLSNNGDISGSTHGNTVCSDRVSREYTLHVGEHTFVIKMALTGAEKGTAVATLGWSAVFKKDSVLANQIPGTHVLVRTDDKGFHVKIGKRESLYSVVSAH